MAEETYAFESESLALLNPNIQKVSEFMTVFGQTVHMYPNVDKIINVGSALYKFRMSLIFEELKETASAIGYTLTKENMTLCEDSDIDVVEFADGIGDLLVVIYGTLLAFGTGGDLENVKFISNFDVIKKEMNKTFNNYSKDVKLNIIRNIMYILPSIQRIANLVNEVNGFTAEFVAEFNAGNLTNPELIDATEEEINSIGGTYNRVRKALEKPAQDGSRFLLLVTSIFNEMLTHAYMLAVYAGIDANVIFDLVHISNMSKLCPTEQNAIETIAENYSNHEIYKNVKYKPAGRYFMVYNDLGDGQYKVLKSKNFKQPEISRYLKAVGGIPM